MGSIVAELPTKMKLCHGGDVILSWYFSVDRITKDQVESDATRTSQTVAEVERWLMTNLGY